MGCGGSKSTTVIESNVDAQRHNKRHNDVINGRPPADKQVNETNTKNAEGRGPVQENERTLHFENGHSAIKGGNNSLAGGTNTFRPADETDGLKSHSSKTGNEQKNDVPIKRHKGVTQEKSISDPVTKVSVTKREAEKKNAVSTKTEQPLSTESAHHVGDSKVKEVSPAQGRNSLRSEDNKQGKKVVSAKNEQPTSTEGAHHDGDPKIKKVSPAQGRNELQSKPGAVVSKTDQNVTTSAPAKPDHRDLKTESPFDPSVNVEKYRRDPIPVFGRGAFPLSKDQHDLTIEDTFWPGKRALIPDYSKMKQMDRHAIETPQRFRKDMDKLVAHLTKVATSDLERLRVIFRWVAHNTEYNVQGFRTGNLGDNSAETVLRTGLAVCDGYSNLVVAMCSKAGVECEKVRGHAKGSGYQPGKENLSKQTHSWNKVTLSGQTFLCDCTWAAGDVDSVYTRHWKEEEFLAEPEGFANSHLPKDLQETPYNSLDDWNSTPQFGHLAHFTALECLTHKEGIIKAPSNTCLIKFKLKRALYNTFCFVENEDRKKMKGVVQHWWSGNELSCSIRLPKAGRYSLVIIGNLLSRRNEKENTEVLYPDHPSHAIGNSLVTYVIKATGSEKLKPMPTEDHMNLFGAALNLPDYGLKPASENRGTIKAVAGSAHVVFKKIQQGPSSVIVELYEFGDLNKKLTSSVYCEHFDDWVVCHVRCPSPGKYILIVYVKSVNEEKSCRVLNTVACEGTFDPIRLPDMRGVSGPNARFAELGLCLKDALTTTLSTSEGEGQLVISSDATKEIKIIADLKGVSESPKNDGSHVVVTTKEKTEQITTVNLRLKQKGFFKLTLYAKDRSMSKNEYIGHWLVVCRKASKKESYPAGASDFGPTAKFHSLGLETETLSRLICIDGEGTLEVCGKPESRTEFIFSLTTGKENEIERQVFADTFVTQGKRLTRFHFRMDKTGTFAFRLFAKSKGSAKHEYVGIWLIENDTVCKKAGYPGRKNTYGPNSIFWDSGLHFDDGISKRLELSDGEGELSFTHKPGTNRKITAHVETAAGGRVDNKSVSTIIEGTWSDKGHITSTKLRLRVKKPGIYDLVVFAENEKGNSFSFAGVWLVDCSKATVKEPFPDVRGTMGPDSKFFMMGLSTVAPLTSTIPADADGICSLQVLRKKPFGVIFNESDKKCEVSVTKSENGKHSFTCVVKLPKPGLYTLDLFASELEERTKDFMGKWLLEWNKK